MLDENLFDELPTFLCLLDNLQNVTFRDNIITFPDQDILDLGWSGIKQFYLQHFIEDLQSLLEQRYIH